MKLEVYNFKFWQTNHDKCFSSKP